MLSHKAIKVAQIEADETTDYQLLLNQMMSREWDFEQSPEKLALPWLKWRRKIDDIELFIWAAANYLLADKTDLINHIKSRPYLTFRQEIWIVKRFRSNIFVFRTLYLPTDPELQGSLYLQRYAKQVGKKWKISWTEAEEISDEEAPADEELRPAVTENPAKTDTPSTTQEQIDERVIKQAGNKEAWITPADTGPRDYSGGKK